MKVPMPPRTLIRQLSLWPVADLIYRAQDVFPKYRMVSYLFPVQRASFFAASDENHRPLSAASNSDQLEDQALAQMKSYSRLVTQWYGHHSAPCFTYTSASK